MAGVFSARDRGLVRLKKAFAILRRDQKVERGFGNFVTEMWIGGQRIDTSFAANRKQVPVC